MNDLLVARGEFPNINWALEYSGLVVSELMVLKSAAGYYWGRCYLEDGYVGPFMRESAIYYKTEADALLDKDTFPIRMCLENDALYEGGVIKHPTSTRH